MSQAKLTQAIPGNSQILQLYKDGPQVQIQLKFSSKIFTSVFAGIKQTKMNVLTSELVQSLLFLDHL